MHKLAQLFLCLGVATLLTACGDDSSDRAEQTEKAIEDAGKDLGFDLDATVNEEGEVEKVEINRGDSVVGQNLDLPAGFPEDVFVSSDWNIMSVSPAPGGGFMVQSLAPQDGKTIIEELRGQMTGQGWSVAAEAETPFPRINFEKDNRVANFNIIPNGESNAVQLMTMTNQ